MKATQFKQHLTKIARISKKSNMPILENTLVVSHAGTITGTVTDLENWVTFDLNLEQSTYSATYTGEPVNALFDTANLVKLRKMNPADRAIFRDGALHFGRYSIKPEKTNIADYPSFRGDKEFCELNANHVNHAIPLVSPAMAVQDVRFYLNGIYIEPKHISATDGHRLHIVDTDSGLTIEPVIVPGDAVKLIDVKQAPSYRVSMTHFQVTYPGIEYTSKLTVGTYPEIHQILEGAKTHTNYQVNTLEFMNELKAIEPCTSPHLNGITLEPGDGEMKLSAKFEQMESTGTIDLYHQSGSSPKGKTGVNIKYLKTALSVMPGTECTFHIKDNNSVMVLSSGDINTLVMPMRV